MALYNLTIISGSLFLIVLLIIPSALFALFAAYTHCSTLFMSELSIIPKSFSLSTTCNLCAIHAILVIRVIPTYMHDLHLSVGLYSSSSSSNTAPTQY